MTFRELQRRLVEDLRERVRSGAVTERRLASLTGVSQPHMHHVLKGKRLLSAATADEILRQLRLDILDLIDPEEIIDCRRRR